MAFYRLFTDGDGQSCAEPIDPKSHPVLVEPQPAQRLFFKRFAAGTVLPPHPAPRRMLTVVVAGELENSFSDGRSLRLRPGDVRLIEDTDSQGHATRVLGEEDALIAVIPLPAAVD